MSIETIIEFVKEIWSTVHGGTWPDLGVWSYVLLALLVATEGPVSTLIGATAAAAGILDIRFVFLSAFLGNVIGDCLWYYVGYVNNLQSIYRRGRWLGLQSHHLERLELEMHTHALKLIGLSKLAIGLIIPTLIAAGLARVPWKRWFPLVLCIEVLWTILMVKLGYHSAELITEFERGMQAVGVAVIALFLVAVVWYARRMYRKSEEAFAAEQQTHQLPAPPLLASEPCSPAVSPNGHATPVLSSSATLKESTKSTNPQVQFVFNKPL
ncbi:MAG: VTT domain-containing protein [Caldilineaceae bacterium]|nr:VTT domain-containing protein [Caldilineaceae bacterium]